MNRSAQSARPVGYPWRAAAGLFAVILALALAAPEAASMGTNEDSDSPLPALPREANPA